MAERAALIRSFLAASPWADWAQAPLAGDASARRYWRLQKGAKSVILMDAPPATTGPSGPFVTIAHWLTSRALAAPEILAHDPKAGLMVLSDLGPTDFAATLETATAAREAELYLAATDVLIHLRAAPPPAGLARMTPEQGAAMIGVLAHYAPGADLGPLQAALCQALTTFAPRADTLALRDFHAENLIWRAGADGLQRVGLLDFQDAFLAPDGYDLASLLRDARRDVSPATRSAVLAHYAAQTGADARFETRIAVLGVQRNLRILGVFARLATEAGKPTYLRFLPRVWQHIMNDLTAPGLGDLHRLVCDTLPATLSQKAPQCAGQ